MYDVHHDVRVCACVVRVLYMHRNLDGDLTDAEVDVEADVQAQTDMTDCLARVSQLEHQWEQLTTNMEVS